MDTPTNQPAVEFLIETPFPSHSSMCQVHNIITLSQYQLLGLYIHTYTTHTQERAYKPQCTTQTQKVSGCGHVCSFHASPLIMDPALANQRRHLPEGTFMNAMIFLVFVLLQVGMSGRIPILHDSVVHANTATHHVLLQLACSAHYRACIIPFT